MNKSPLPSTIAIAGMPLHFAQEIPAARADVALLDRAAVHGDRRHAALECAVEDREELVAAFRAVVEAAAHLHRHRNRRRHGVAHAADDLQAPSRLGSARIRRGSARAPFSPGSRN